MDAVLANLLKGFFRAIYVITLPQFVVRQKALEETLSSLPHTLFYGQDKEKLDLDAEIKTKSYSPTRAAYYLHRPLNRAEVACAYSHYALHAHLLKEGLFPVLILEDDVGLKETDTEATKIAFSELPTNWEICYLGYEKNEYFGPLQRTKELLYTLFYKLGSRHRLKRELNHYHARPFSSQLKRAGSHTGTHAYGVSEAGCIRLYEKQKPICMIADCLLNELVVVDKMPAFLLKRKIFTNKSVSGTIPSTLK